MLNDSTGERTCVIKQIVSFGEKSASQVKRGNNSIGEKSIKQMNSIYQPQKKSVFRKTASSQCERLDKSRLVTPRRIS